MPAPITSNTPSTRPIASRGRIPVGGKDSIDFSPVNVTAPVNPKPVGGKDTFTLEGEPFRPSLKSTANTKSINNLGEVQSGLNRKHYPQRSSTKLDGWFSASSSDQKRVRKASSSPDHSTCKSVLRHDLWTPSYIDSPRKVGKVGPSPGGPTTLVLG